MHSKLRPVPAPVANVFRDLREALLAATLSVFARGAGGELDCQNGIDFAPTSADLGSYPRGFAQHVASKIVKLDTWWAWTATVLPVINQRKVRTRRQSWFEAGYSEVASGMALSR